MHKNWLCRHPVSLSITFVYCVEMSKHILTLFSPSGSHAILVFHTKRYGNIPMGTLSNAGVLKITIFHQYLN